MLVDDHQIVRQGIRSLIETMPDCVLCAEAADGEAALKIAPDARPDVVVLDVSMPKISGLDVFLDMKAHNPDVRVVVVSGYFEPTMKSNLSAAGIKYFLAKPYSLNQVVDALRDSLTEL